MSRIGVNAVGLFLLLVLVLLSTRSIVYGILGVALSGFLVGLMALGADRFGTVMIGLAMFTAPMNDRDYRPLPGGPITFSDVFFAVGFMLLIGTMLKRHSRLPPEWAAGSIIVVGAVLVSSALGPTPGVGINYGSRLIAAAVLLPLAMLWWRPTRDVIEGLAWAYIAGAVASSMFAVLEGPAVGTRYDGLATHVNFFALGGLIGIALLIHKWFVVPSNQRWIVLACAAACFFAIWFSGSRAALLVMGVLILIVPVIERSALSAYAVLALAATAVASAEWLLQRAGEGSALARLKGDSSTTGSDTERREALAAGFEKWLLHPIMGKSFGEDSLAAHNIYLQVMVGVGLVGLVGFLLILASALRPLFGTGELRRLGYTALAFGGVGMITNSLWDRFTWAALSLSILAAVADPSDPDDTSTPATTPSKAEAS